MEYSLERIVEPRQIIQFDTLDQMFNYIRAVGEINAWIIRVHHM